jgi:hypothetical protein
MLTLVLGGDGEKTIDHVMAALKSKYPVIIVKGSSSVPTLLAELFYALEDKLSRSGRYRALPRVVLFFCLANDKMTIQNRDSHFRFDEQTYDDEYAGEEEAAVRLS